MKLIHNLDTQYQKEVDQFIDWLAIKKSFEEKVRINLYLPKIVVKYIDSLSKNKSRGELVTNLVINEIKKNKKQPFGLFSGIEISEEEIDEITSSWNKINL